MPEHPARGAPFIGYEQQQVAGSCAEFGNQRRLLRVGEELGDRRLECAALAHLDPHQSLGAELFGTIGELVELVATHGCSFRIGRGIHTNSLDRSRGGKRLEFGSGEHPGEFRQLHGKAHVGLVGSETIHCVVPGDSFDWWWRHARRSVSGRQNGLRYCRQHVVLVDETHLCVELCEFVLSIGAQVFVTQAAGDLVVAIHASHHEQLLPQLWRLRQRIERARLLARRYQELARPFRC